MSKTAEYILSSYSFIYTHSKDELLNVGYRSKEGNPIPSFDEALLIKICSEATQIFESEHNLLEIEGDLIVVGDLHGSFHDLLRILKYTQDKKSKVLFLGDYVDRGNFSLECITLLFSLKISEPNQYFLLRGNHEFDSICCQYGFLNEILNYHNPKKIKETFSEREKTINFNSINSSSDESIEEYNYKDVGCYKYSKGLYDSFMKAFSYLPIAAIVNKTNLCIHGGLGRNVVNLDQIRFDIKRPVNEFEENELLSDIVWSDPCTVSACFFSENPRGRGFLFSKDALFHFLSENSLKRLIRAHECVKNGSIYNFHEKCITVFSASSYTKEIENKSGILKLFQKDDSIKFVTFHPLQRLEKSDAIYYKVQPFVENRGKIRLCNSYRLPHLTLNSAVRSTQNKTVRNMKSLISVPNLCGYKMSSRLVTGKKDNVIQKRVIRHSNSMDGFETKEANEPDSILMKIQTLNSHDDLPSLNDI